MKIKLILWKLQSFSELSSSYSGQHVDLRLPGLPVWWPAAPGPTECGWVTSDRGAGTPSGAEELGWGSSCSWQRCCVTAVSLAALQTAGGFPIQSKCKNSFHFSLRPNFNYPKYSFSWKSHFPTKFRFLPFLLFFRKCLKLWGLCQQWSAKKIVPIAGAHTSQTQLPCDGQRHDF